MIHQGDIIKIESLKGYYLVTSKNFFDTTREAFLCPIAQDTFPDPLHIAFDTPELRGRVLCEHLRLIDLRKKEIEKIAHLKDADLVDIMDAIQSIFDY